MHKAISFFLLVTCAFAACRQNNNNYLNLIENDWKKDKLKGRVKKIVKRDSVTGSSDLHSSIVEYNEKGFLAQKVDSSIMPHKTMVVTYEYRYDTINNTTFVSILLNGVQQKQEQYEYDQAGNLVTVTRYFTKTKYTYDNKSRVLEELNYQGNELLTKVKYEYLANGDQKETLIEATTGIIRTEKVKNDTMEISKTWDQGGELRKIWLRKKDTAGHIIYAEEKDPDNKLVGYSRNYYNEFNDMVMSVNFEVKKNAFDTLAMKYTYDKFGNYTSVDGTWKREITYW